MIGLVVVNAIADQGGPLAYGKSFLLGTNTLLDSLTAVNKGDACYVQLIDTPRLLDVAITDTDNLTGIYTAPAHGFVTGDRIVVVVNGVPTPSRYLGVVDADSFKMYATRANALAGTSAMGITDPDLTGTLNLQSNASGAGVVTLVAEEYPLAAAASAPANVLSYTAGRFTRGLYVRAVTAINGSTLISGDDVKFTPRYRTGDVIKTVPYED